MRGLLTNDIMAPALTPTLTIFFHDFAAAKQLKMFVPGHKPWTMLEYMNNSTKLKNKSQIYSFIQYDLKQLSL